MAGMSADPPDRAGRLPRPGRADLLTGLGSALYGVAWAAALTLGAPVIAARALRDPREMRERLGIWDLPTDSPTGGLWVHAASLGELRGALPLVRALSASGPPPDVSVVTPTARGQAGEAEAAGARLVRFAPLDFQPLAAHLMRRLRPRGLLICETEIWPGLIAAALMRRVPVAFVSARLTARGAARLGPARPWLGRLLRATHVAAQTKVDAARWRSLGVPAAQVALTGNTKYERPRPCTTPEQRCAARGGWRHLVVFGSVRGPETDAVATALRACAGLAGPALCVVVPRHPGRADRMSRALAGCLPRMCERRDKGAPLLPEVREVGGTLLFVRTTGELQRFFAIADLAFVGATLCPLGGHNLFEVAELGVPVLYGPHTEQVSDVAAMLECEGGGWRVADGTDLGATILRLAGDPRQLAEGSRGAYRAAQRLGGAVSRTLTALHAWGFPVPAPDEAGD